MGAAFIAALIKVVKAEESSILESANVSPLDAHVTQYCPDPNVIIKGGFKSFWYSDQSSKLNGDKTSEIKIDL